MNFGRALPLPAMLAMVAAVSSVFAAPAATSSPKPAAAQPLAAVSPTAPAARLPQQSVRLTYDMSDLPLTIVVDKTGTAHIEELPFPGEVIYQTSTGTIFYRHPEEEGWLAVPPTALAPVLVQGTVTPGAKWQPFNGQPTQQWEVKAGTTLCDQWYASPSAAKQSGLNVGDILHILTAVQWLNGGSVPNTCEKLDVPAATAEKIGLPVLFTGPNGRWKLHEVVAENVPTIAIPKATPISPEARLRLLLVQYSPEERAHLLTKFAGMSPAQQVDAISAMLSQDSLP